MASSEKEMSLIASLDLYNSQLNQVEACLQSDESGLNRDDLIQLQNDLREIIHLIQQNIAAIQCKTVESLEENVTTVTSTRYRDDSSPPEADFRLSKPSSCDTPGSVSNISDNIMDAEYAAFQRLLADDLSRLEDNKATTDQTTDDAENDGVIQIDSDKDNEEAIEIYDSSSEDSEDAEGDDEDEDDLFGQKCQAPFSHPWGQRGYYNAIVLSRAKNESKDSELHVEVVFCYPTHCSMRLCPYYLSGNCRYETHCRYSHGEVVKMSDLRPFEDPDFSCVAVGSPCLVRDDNDIWYEATMMEVLDDGQFHIQFKANHHLKTVNVKDLFPLDHETEESHVDDNNDDDGDGEADEAVTPSFSSSVAPVDIKTTEALGQWESHTKGIGSKLMAKMGYVAGQGLGRNNEGRAEPVHIELLPKGISLDKVMELKNLANNDNLFDALKKQKRKQKQQSLNKKDPKSTEGPKTQSPSVFDFINNKLRPSKVKHTVKHRNPHNAKDTKFISTRELKTKSDKHLNVQLLKTSEELKNTERQILRLKDSIQRANERGDHVAVKNLAKKIDSLHAYTSQLKTSEALMHNQKKSRKAHNLLTKF